MINANMRVSEMFRMLEIDTIKNEYKHAKSILAIVASNFLNLANHSILAKYPINESAIKQKIM
jgi:hypothetical protein